MKKSKIILIAAVGFIALMIMAGFVVVPAIVKPILEKKMSEALHRKASIEKLKINPIRMALSVHGFRLTDPGAETPFVAFDELYVNASLFASAFRRALVIEEIRLDKPYIGLTRKADGTYNFSDLIPREESKKEEPPPKPFLFSLNNIQINEGQIDFTDAPNQTAHTVRDLQLAVPFISNISHYTKTHVEPKFAAVVNGHAVSATGKTQPFQASRATHLDIDIRDVDVPHYLQYVPARMNFKLSSARLDTHLKIQFLMDPEKAPSLQITGHAALRKVILDDLRGNQILRLPELQVEIAAIEPFVPKVHLARVTLNAPELALKRDKEGNINLATLFGMDKKEAVAGGKDIQAAPAKKGEAQKDLVLLIDRFLIDKADMTWTDALPAKPVKISMSPLRLEVSGLSLEKGKSAAVELALSVDKKANITAKGAFGLKPLSADLALGVEHLAIRPFEPYFAESVELDVVSGSVFTTGQLTLKMDDQEKPVITYSGNLSVGRLATIDRISSHDFIKFQKLSLNTLSAGYNPLFVKIHEIALSDFFAKIVINEGGITNIQNIFGAAKNEESKPDDAAAEKRNPEGSEETPAGPSPDISIGNIRFSGGTIDFADQNIKPHYAVHMLNLHGAITGLSSKDLSRAKVDLKGNLGHGSPVEISGTINPLTKDLFADIHLSFKNIDMSPVTPYTAKFLGYPITKGKVTFEVSYLIDHRKLRAENKVFFDQLTFGEKVESPDAISAPVPLAVSLLTDRNGQINLDIPLSGSLDDPEFRILPLVWQILVNLITKAVTSPFSLLSTMTGGGEEMSYIEFEFGSARIPEGQREKIDVLAKVLFDRPGVKLEIEGYVAVTENEDREALRKTAFRHLLQVQKHKEVSAKGEAPASVEEISISDAEYEKYLTLAYKAADFPKPRTAIGTLKELPPADMEKMLNDHVTISDGDLGQLAARRARTVHEQLLSTEKVDAARLFLVKPAGLSPAGKEKVKDSRVEFKLK